jgi:hypothetical protein
MSMEEPHAHIKESMESLSASSFSLLFQVLRQLCESLCFIVQSSASRSSPASSPAGSLSFIINSRIIPFILFHRSESSIYVISNHRHRSSGLILCANCWSSRIFDDENITVAQEVDFKAVSSSI